MRLTYRRILKEMAVLGVVARQDHPVMTQMIPGISVKLISSEQLYEMKRLTNISHLRYVLSELQLNRWLVIMWRHLHQVQRGMAQFMKSMGDGGADAIVENEKEISPPVIILR